MFNMITFKSSKRINDKQSIIALLVQDSMVLRHRVADSAVRSEGTEAIFVQFCLVAVRGENQKTFDSFLLELQCP